MRIYRVRLVDGRERLVAADRVTGNEMSTTFEVRSQDQWQIVLHLPADGIASVARRITEVDGRWTWVRTDPEQRLRAPRNGVAAAEEVESTRG